MALSRRDLARALAAPPPAAVVPSHAHGQHPPRVRPDAAWAGVQIGVALPAGFGPLSAAAEAVLTTCASLGVQVVEVGGRAIEGMLGAPAAPSLWLPSPQEALESGLLPTEEEMLEDERELARQSFAAQLRGWRSSVPLSPLVTLRNCASNAGIRVDVVRWPGMATLSAEEADYGCRVARALGAAALSTAFSLDGLAEVAATAERHGMFVGLRGDTSIGPGEYEAAFRHGTFIGATLDIARWVLGGHGSPVALLDQHTGRITHLALEARAVDEAADTPFGESAAIIREVLQQMRDRQWPFPAIITLADGEARDDATTEGRWREQESAFREPMFQREQCRALERAIGYCRTCLSR